MCRYITSLVFIIPYFILFSANAQNITIHGRVIDSLTKEPISYANISVLSLNDSLIAGSMTNDNGAFKITTKEIGVHKVIINFIGYNQVAINDFRSSYKDGNIGEIALQIIAENLEAVVIQGNRSPIMYKVDRKIITAENSPEANVAMDLLENIPSVQLNFDGKLTYRGEGVFKVYVNGNPVNNGDEKLRQIPASQIDRIEIITNPSAKYNSEGTAGIIQVILKKSRLEGYNISSSIKLDNRGEYYGLFSIDKKEKKYGWYLQGQYCRYIWEKYSKEDFQHVNNENKLYETSFNTKHKNKEFKTYIELGFNYDITKKDYINFSGYISPFKIKKRNEGEGNVVETIIDENNVPQNSSYDYLHNLYYDYQYTGATITYEHRFNKERSHLLSLFVDFSGYIRETSDKNIDTKIFKDYTERVGYIAGEKNEIVTTVNLAYKVPFSQKISFEAGININTNNIPESHSTSGTFDTNENITGFENEPLNQTVDFKQNIYSGYSTLEANFGKFDLMLGARIENTQRNSDYSYDSLGNRKTIPTKNDFTNLFPTAHLTYNFSEESQLYFSYTKRIHRPDYWSLIPLMQYETPYSYYKGNGNLKPSHSNAFEVGFRKSWGRNFIASEIFVRQTNDVTQNYSRSDSANILSYIPENVGKSTNIGLELMSGVDIFKWWNVNLSASLFSSKLKVDFKDIKETKEKFRIDGRINNTFKLPKSFTLRWDFNYKSPMHDAQKIREGYFYSNASLRKGFKDNKWAIVLAYHNIFSTIKYNTTLENSTFLINNYYKEDPYVSLRIIYTFNNQK